MAYCPCGTANAVRLLEAASSASGVAVAAPRTARGQILVAVCSVEVLRKRCHQVWLCAMFRGNMLGSILEDFTLPAEAVWTLGWGLVLWEGEQVRVLPKEVEEEGVLP